jgi:hypothetical protein
VLLALQSAAASAPARASSHSQAASNQAKTKKERKKKQSFLAHPIQSGFLLVRDLDLIAIHAAPQPRACMNRNLAFRVLG